MSKPFEQIAGTEIDIQLARYDSHAMVTIHKLGSPDRIFLTPDEAKRLGGALINAAMEVVKP